EWDSNPRDPGGHRLSRPARYPLCHPSNQTDSLLAVYKLLRKTPLFSTGNALLIFLKITVINVDAL
ncbi:hypothetical protein MUO98_00205, partial [Candidatus Bathyarchaeota archaeon]|nr:hypothetical protein [Candidatus Bathyarchaeota archaeon]